VKRPILSRTCQGCRGLSGGEIGRILGALMPQWRQDHPNNRPPTRATAISEMGQSTTRLPRCSNQHCVIRSPRRRRGADEGFGKSRGRSDSMGADGGCSQPTKLRAVGRSAVNELDDAPRRPKRGRPSIAAGSRGSAAITNEAPMPATQDGHPKRSKTWPRTALPTMPPKK
jgi:hypothetical protein